MSRTGWLLCLAWVLFFLLLLVGLSFPFWAPLLISGSFLFGGNGRNCGG